MPTTSYVDNVIDTAGEHITEERLVSLLDYTQWHHIPYAFELYAKVTQLARQMTCAGELGAAHFEKLRIKVFRKEGDNCECHICGEIVPIPASLAVRIDILPKGLSEYIQLGDFVYTDGSTQQPSTPHCSSLLSL